MNMTENGDELVSFGPIFYETNDAMNCIPAYVGSNVNKPVDIQVRRLVSTQQMVIKLTLTPKSWGGRGLLGCHLKPKQ